MRPGLGLLEQYSGIQLENRLGCEAKRWLTGNKGFDLGINTGDSDLNTKELKLNYSLGLVLQGDVILCITDNLSDFSRVVTDHVRHVFYMDDLGANYREKYLLFFIKLRGPQIDLILSHWIPMWVLSAVEHRRAYLIYLFFSILLERQ